MQQADECTTCFSALLMQAMAKVSEEYQTNTIDDLKSSDENIMKDENLALNDTINEENEAP